MPESRTATPLAADPAASDRRLGPSPWPWMLLACTIIGASGAVRINQEQQFVDAARAAERTPFPMRDLPTELGDPELKEKPWTMLGEEHSLEAETQQIAGCSDYMYRDYVDERTGVTLTVLVAFGPAERVFPHSPLVCFPANGFQKRGGPWRRTIGLDGSEAPRKATFDALAYGKSGGGLENLREVYYSYWHDGEWSPVAEKTRKLFRHRPAMIKVQVERPIIPGEVGLEDGPIEGFLEYLVPEIERRLAAERVEFAD